MNLRIVLILSFLFTCLFTLNTNAQSGYGYSYLESYRDQNTGEPRIYAETGTIFDYTFSYYYDPGIEATVYKNSIVHAHRDRTIAPGYAGIILYLDEAADYDNEFRLHGDHYVRAYWYNNTNNGPQYIDYFGLNYFAGVFPPPYGFLQGPTGYYFYRIYRVATTRVMLTIPRPPIHLDSIDNTGLTPGYNYVTFLRGTGLFGSGQSVSVSGSGVTVRIRPGQLPNTIEVLEIELDIDEDAPRGDRQITLMVNGTTSNSLTFRVGDRSPQITGMTPPEGNTGETVPVTISGSNFGFNPIVSIDGVGVHPTVTSSSTTQITALFSVADATYIGQRGVRVTSRGLTGTGFMQVTGTSDTSSPVDFTVYRPVISIDPFDSVEKNGRRNITIRITGSRSSSTFRASMRQGNGVGGMVFEENGGPGIDLLPTGNTSTFTKTIVSRGSTSTTIDDWELRVEGNGATTVFEMFTVSYVKFEEEANCTGFDSVEMPHPYLMVPQNGNNRVKAKIQPAGASGTFNFSGVEPNGISVSPSTINNNEQLLTISAGNTVGEFTLQALANGATEPASSLKTAVRRRINKTVVIHAVTEDNDDVQRIPIGQGEPSQIAIRPAPDTRLRTTIPSGDDQIATIGELTRTKVVTTGTNGIRETPMVSGDVEVIPMNQGMPNSICVTKGTNNFSDTNVSSATNGDDNRDSSDNIVSGPNGVCQTTANSTDIVPSEASIPSAQALQDYLNNNTWGRQANIFFTVTRDSVSHQVNFDLDRDGMFNGNRLGRSDEYFKIEERVRNPDADMDLYYTGVQFAAGGDVDDAGAEAVPFGNGFGSVFFTPSHTGTTIYLAAHEIGHILMPNVSISTVHSNSILDLMYRVDLLASPCRIRKRDWDTLINN